MMHVVYKEQEKYCSVCVCMCLKERVSERERNERKIATKHAEHFLYGRQAIFRARKVVRQIFV